MKVYVVINPEDGWDCIRGVYSTEKGVVDYIKEMYDNEDGIPDSVDGLDEWLSDNDKPYIIFTETVI